MGKLILEDNSSYDGVSFGGEKSAAGEVVFSTGMMGYPESLTDPSYKGQIIVCTYPIIGNYGVADKEFWESNKIQASGIIVSTYNKTPSHFQNQRPLGEWLKDEGIPGLEISDTRFLTQLIRTKGTMLGKIIVDDPERSRMGDIPFYDPNLDNLVAQVSTTTVQKFKGEKAGKWHGKTVVLIDCGIKNNIQRLLIKKGVNVIIVPWNFDPFENFPHLGGVHSARLAESKRATSEVLRSDSSEVNSFDAIIVSNGPGDPKLPDKTIQTILKALNRKFPTLGICLGHQLLGLAAGGDTQKLKFGHRSQNQPCIDQTSNRCYITTQNHGFHVAKIPPGFKPWFINANDGSNEGIIHKSLPFMSVQFHPEATPGPIDTEWIFDYFLTRITK